MKKLILLLAVFTLIPVYSSVLAQKTNILTNIDVLSMNQEEFSNLLHNILYLANKNDHEQITNLYKNIHYKEGNDDLYIDRVQQILWMVWPPLETDSTLRKEMIRLAESVINIDVPPPPKQYKYSALGKQLRTFERVLGRYEFKYQVLERRSSLQEILDLDHRKKRIDQLLTIWQKQIVDIDDTWDPEALPMTSMDVNGLYGAIGFLAVAEVIQETKHLSEEEKEKVWFKLREQSIEKYRKEVDEKVKPYFVYQHQQSLHKWKDELEPGVIGLIATLYSIKPYNDKELAELLKKHKMNEKFTRTVFEELKKRMMKSKN